MAERPNEPRIAAHLEQTLMLITALVQHVGYDKASAIAKVAAHKGVGLRQAAVRLGYVTEAEFSSWMRADQMICPKSTQGTWRDALSIGSGPS